jgi:ribonuclease-3
MAKHEFDELEAALGHRFHNPELLAQALTHSSHAHESEAADGAESGDNEQLEFLGDAVLGFVASEVLYRRFPDFQEGQLSKLRAHLVSARYLVNIAGELDLGRFLRLGRGEEKSGGRTKSALLANCLEAILAALYLDSGMEKTRAFVFERILNPELERLDQQSALHITDHKSALQEFLQAAGKPQPSYTVVKEEGPEHKKTFTVELRVHAPGVGKPLLCRGQGPTKKRAEQRAAQHALEQLREHAGASVTPTVRD